MADADWLEDMDSWDDEDAFFALDEEMDAWLDDFDVGDMWDEDADWADTGRGPGGGRRSPEDQRRIEAQREARRRRREDRSRDAAGQTRSGEGRRDHERARRGPQGTRPQRTGGRNRERNVGIDGEEHTMRAKGQGGRGARGQRHGFDALDSFDMGMNAWISNLEAADAFGEADADEFNPIQWARGRIRCGAEPPDPGPEPVEPNPSSFPSPPDFRSLDPGYLQARTAWQAARARWANARDRRNAWLNCIRALELSRQLSGTSPAPRPPPDPVTQGPQQGQTSQAGRQTGSSRTGRQPRRP